VQIEHSPIVALVVIRSVPSGNNLAELSSIPFLEIFLSVELINLEDCFVMSVGTAHNISPFQYSSLFESGVPPPTISPTCSNFWKSQVSGISSYFPKSDFTSLYSCFGQSMQRNQSMLKKNTMLQLLPIMTQD